MSQKDDVVRRTSAKNRRKTPDGNRSDSGCFDDVDVVQMVTQQNPGLPLTDETSSSEEIATVSSSSESEVNENPSSTDDRPPKARLPSDEAADDTDFRVILERLTEVTKNPGDLYRLCFSSRLSFAGLSLNGVDDEGSSCQPGEPVMEDKSVVVSDCPTVTATAKDSGITVDGGCSSKETAPHTSGHKDCGNRQQCVELLSMLSSFVEKASETPAVFSQSGLGKSLLGQLSSLLSTLEEARNDANTSRNTQHRAVLANQTEYNEEQNTQHHPVLDNQRKIDYNEDQNAQHQVVLDNQRKTEYNENQNTQHHLVLNNQRKTEHNIDRITSNDTHPFVQGEDTPLIHIEPSPGQQLCEDIEDNESVEDPKGSIEALPVFDDVVQPMSLASASAPCLPRVSVGDDSDHLLSPDLEGPPLCPPGDGDVVSNGRRTVTPYSWDYGDIWEKELQRARSTDSFGGDNSAGGKQMPTFEEIRDDLFHEAGFIRGKDPKRRSRSADARSSYQDDPHWLVAFPGEETGTQSPFVRTVYQQQGYPNSGLTRSHSTHLIGGDSLTVNVDQSQGRRVRVFSDHPKFDDSWALVLKDTVVETSTFRGPKPWATLKRRPSGLRRRSNSLTRPGSFGSSQSSESSEFLRTRFDSRGESESSDSPYCATSSDCFTTDDSSSITSSHYAAASSVQSSPRNSSCFSDRGSLSDLRRVVFQDTLPDTYPGERSQGKYSGGRSLLSKKARGFPLRDRGLSVDHWEMTLDQRFSCMSRNNGVFSEPGDQYLKVTTNSLARHSNQRNGGFRSSDTDISQNSPTTSLLVRSDSDLNSLTRVQFVGDSYSRSHISKNVRHARRQSRSPSPGTRSTHTRVVSCEIVESDKDKQGVYTKVNLSRSEYDDDTTSDDNTLLRSTRRSWHGHSPQRGSLRSQRGSTNATPRRVNSERHTCPTGLVDRRRQIFVPRRIDQHREEKPLHAKLVEVRNIQEYNTYRNNGPGDLRSSSDSNCARYFSRPPSSSRGYQTSRNDNSRQVPKHLPTSRSKNFGRAQALFERPERTTPESNRRRMPPIQPLMTSPFRSNFGKKKATSGSHRQDAPQNAKSFGHSQGKSSNIERRSSQKTTASSGLTKEPIVVKETSFVGPATFTKYQSPTSFKSKTYNAKHGQRPRSLGDKDNITKPREDYRQQAMRVARREMKSGIQNRSDSDSGFVSQPERIRRRHSEGAWGTSRTESGQRGDLVGESYCDPRRESVQEGTYSLVSAESARNEVKSGKDRSSSEEGRVPVTVESKEKINEGTQPTRDNSEKHAEKGLPSNVVESDGKRERVPQLEDVQSIEPNSMDVEIEERVDNIIIDSPILQRKDFSRSPNGVNVCIDYRNKKPVSMEYYDVGNDGIECRSGDLTKPSKMNLLRKCKGLSKQIIQTKQATTSVSEDIPKATVVNDLLPRDLDMVESPRKRLSRRDRHEQEMFGNKGNGKEDEKDSKVVEVPLEAESPVPYRRDKTIVYIDARSSIDSDTDSSVSHHSISSSGSDMTVIMNDEQDISADDLRQLAQNSSDIGLEISPLELDSSDDLIDSPDITPEKNPVNPVDWSAALNDATRSANERYSTNASVVSNWKVTALPPGNDQLPDFPPKDTAPAKTTHQVFKNDSKIRNNFLKFEQKVSAESSLSSNTSSVESHKGIGSSSAKHIGGKGFFSRLKNLRNSFRGKKTDGKVGEKSSKTARHSTKNAEKDEKAAMNEIKTALGSRSLPIIDRNCNEMCVPSDTFEKWRKSSVDYSKETAKEATTDDKSRSTYDNFQQQRRNLRNVVGVKSVSSEHLHSLRVNRRSAKMSAKSLEVLLETCI